MGAMILHLIEYEKVGLGHGAALVRVDLAGRGIEAVILKILSPSDQSHQSFRDSFQEQT